MTTWEMSKKDADKQVKDVLKGEELHFPLATLRRQHPSKFLYLQKKVWKQENPDKVKEYRKKARERKKQKHE